LDIKGIAMIPEKIQQFADTAEKAAPIIEDLCYSAEVHFLRSMLVGRASS